MQLWETAMRNQENYFKEREREMGTVLSNSPGGLLTRKTNEMDILLYTFKCNREFMVLLKDWEISSYENNFLNDTNNVRKKMPSLAHWVAQLCMRFMMPIIQAFMNALNKTVIWIGRIKEGICADGIKEN